MRFLTLTALLSSTVAAQSDPTSTIGGLSGKHTDIPRWCGKPYMPGVQNYNPGGMLYAPAPSAHPLLYVQVEPRHSIYDSSEATGQFIVDAAISYTHGEPYTNSTPQPGSHETAPFTMLEFDIRVEENDELLISQSVPVNSTDNLFGFDLKALKPRLHPYNIVLYGTPMHSNADQKYIAKTQLYYLPAKNSGSSVKVDNLHGGMLVANNKSSYHFEPLLPFGFYTSCGGYLNYSLANVTAYKDLGFNSINPVCSFQDGNLDYLFDWLDQSNLWYQYDMRGSYLNLTQVEQQIPLVKDRSNLLTWYTADEPDGWQYALNSTRLAYNLLKKMDPYHPTALVLNCDNYYYKEYTSGADIVMQDAYPIGLNATYSRPWKTNCNETYGDCGCDDCVGELQDVSNRLDDLTNYQQWLGQSPKPLWSVLQAFSGEGYWERDPTPEETWAMITISLNHGAKGVMSWVFPSTTTLNNAHSEMAKVASGPQVAQFLIGADAHSIKVKGHSLLDVAYWILGKQVLVGFANLDYIGTKKSITIDLPFHVSNVASQPWGSASWSIQSGKLVVKAPAGLATSLVLLDMA